MSLQEVFLDPYFVGYLLLQFVVYGGLIQLFSKTKYLDKNVMDAAHQFTSVGSFTFFGLFGVYTWFFDEGFAQAFGGWDSTADVRLFAFYAPARVLVHTMVGYMVFDTICLIASRAAPEFFAHHILTFSLALIGLTYGETYFALYYGVFFFGVCEFSSMPLAFVDLFRNNRELAAAFPTASTTLRSVFAFGFILIRGCYWPYMVFFFVRDLLTGTDVKWLAFILYGFTAVALTAMQYFWLFLIFKGVQKQFCKGEGTKVGNALEDRQGSLSALAG